MFYVWALVAIVGAVGYHYFVKRVPENLNPIVSIIGLYAGVLLLAAALLPVVQSEGGLLTQVRQLSWIQIALAVFVFMIEIGFLMMYRNGWELSTGNLVTNVVVTLVLVALGVFVLGERLSAINMFGIGLSIVGVGLISYR